MKYYLRLVILFLPLALLLSVLYEQLQLPTGPTVLLGIGVGVLYTVILFYIFKKIGQEIV